MCPSAKEGRKKGERNILSIWQKMEQKDGNQRVELILSRIVYLKHVFSTTNLPTEKSLRVFMLLLKQDKHKDNVKVTR